jgi:tetratricopeptide (TPR) repeat protein
MRHLLVLFTTLACFQGCTCQGRSSTSVDAGIALSPPPAVQPPPPVSERAMQLHLQGRKHGEAGELEMALRYFHEAQLAAPTWPLPLYDLGLTFLYMKADDRALEAYTQLDTLAPGGISDSKRMLDSLRREQDGRVPKGTLREFIEIQRLMDLEQIRRRLEALTQKAPAFVPAWQELAKISSERPEEAERLLAQALSLQPDAWSRAELLVYKSTLLRRRGETEAARKLLQALAGDPSTPPGAAAEARELLNIPGNVTP